MVFEDVHDILNTMRPPQNLDAYLRFITTETARTAWPGSMMRGKKQVLRQGAKQAVERFFQEKFPMGDLWLNPSQVADHYEAWHRRVSKDLAEALRGYMGAKRNTTDAVAAKLLDTFMHQLMKTERARVLWHRLHLPLDRRVFDALSRRGVEFDGKAKIATILKKPPYSITRAEYETVQESMWSLLKRMPADSAVGLRWTSRIELNWLWI